MASLIYGLAGKLVGELGSPLFKDYLGKPWELGIKSEFEKLKNTVSAIEAVLLDAEEKQRTNRQVQDWLIKIKLVFYDLEDLLQEVRTQDLKRRVKTKNKRAKKVRIFFSHSNQLKYRLKMGRKVKLIRERMDAIASDSKRFNFAQLHKEMPANSHRREETHSYIPVEKYVGRDADKEHVTSLLLRSDVVDKVSVISIIGIGGMGKTTLAQSVYNSDEIKSKFELRMWVCVSDPFDVKLICENIIMSVTSNRCDGLPMDIVQKELKSSIDGKKYLLVLDDVWNEKKTEWEKLEVLLADGARGSKILITARAELVADAAKSNARHFLKGLSPEESWVLFKQGVEQVSPTMEGIGKDVLVKCAGVPLVVKAMGSILALKKREIDWLDFKKYDLPRVSQDSEGTVLPILRFSYDYLSAPLKRCFVYCAIYPKDHEIEKEELIGMWVAHGLIQLDGTRRSLEDVGERHFMDLLSRSFFEVQMTRWGLDCYKMHDLIHDLAQSVGGDEYYKHGSDAKCMVKSTRHAWVSGDKLTNIGHDGEKLHTLVVTKPYDENKINELTSSTFQQLRVLRLGGLWLKSVPQFVGGLRHLYYLDLAGNKFAFLPESICSLYNLQTLILSNCSNLEELPAGTRDLGSLRRLDIRGCGSLRSMPRGLEELTCLQTLSHFVCPKEGDQRRSYAEVCELKSLVNLRGLLPIIDLRGSLANAEFERKRSCILVELELITELELRWKEGQYEEELKEEEEEAELLLIGSLKPHPNLERLIIKYYQGSKFPSWMDRVNIGVSLPNIVYIHLYDCGRLRHLPAIGLLPCLQQLRLCGMIDIEHLIDSSSSTLEEEAEEPLFPSLKELHLNGMYQLKRVLEPTESSGNKRYFHFPVLEKLVIEYCPLFLADGSNEDGKLFASLLELSFSGMEFHGPSGLQYLPHLQILTIFDWYEIVSLPDWMGNLTSLQELHLDGLHSLASIPDCLQRLVSLQKLQIYKCPKLVRRCKKKTGGDWHKIAHIPDITIDGELLSDSESAEESEDLSCPGEESKDQNEEHELLDLSLHL